MQTTRERLAEIEKRLTELQRTRAQLQDVKDLSEAVLRNTLEINKINEHLDKLRAAGM